MIITHVVMQTENIKEWECLNLGIWTTFLLVFATSVLITKLVYIAFGNYFYVWILVSIIIIYDSLE